MEGSLCGEKVSWERIDRHMGIWAGRQAGRLAGWLAGWLA
jgi:hypothetical protein